MHRELRALPKAHLHLHLEAAMRPSTLLELGAEHGIDVPDMASATTFTDFIALYEAATDVLRRPEDLQRLLRELAEDAAADGAAWVEYFVYPPLWLDRFGSDADALDACLDAARLATEATGVGLGAIVTADRTLDPALGEHIAQVAAARADDGVVGFGLANDETHFPPEPFERAFAIALEGGLMSVPHAGELAGPASVRAALDVLHAERIGHGARSVEDPELVRRLADEGITCDVCPTSNIALSIYPSYAEHAIGTLVDAGVPVTINTDDPLMFGTTLAEEWMLVRDAFGWSDEQMAAIARTSITASAAPDATKAAVLTSIDAWLA
ncbi:MAG TPA: adenosine deaminase [Acidimicrobiales bacterium]|nr:adenosine deaminase [Acidimicrobiales bacterium]